MSITTTAPSTCFPMPPKRKSNWLQAAVQNPSILLSTIALCTIAWSGLKRTQEQLDLPGRVKALETGFEQLRTDMRDLASQTRASGITLNSMNDTLNRLAGLIDPFVSRLGNSETEIAKLRGMIINSQIQGDEIAKRMLALEKSVSVIPTNSPPP